jgi:hypothetical protein
MMEMRGLDGEKGYELANLETLILKEIVGVSSNSRVTFPSVVLTAVCASIVKIDFLSEYMRHVKTRVSSYLIITSDLNYSITTY